MVGWGFRQRLADLCLPVEAEHFGLLQTSVDGGGVLYKKTLFLESWFFWCPRYAKLKSENGFKVWSLGLVVNVQRLRVYGASSGLQGSGSGLLYLGLGLSSLMPELSGLGTGAWGLSALVLTLSSS